MFSIYKYSLLEDKIVAPIERILKVDVQDDIPFLWAEVNTDAPKVSIIPIILPTGDLGKKGEKWDKLQYADTIFLNNGTFVYHVYLLSEQPLRFATDRPCTCHTTTKVEAPKIQAVETKITRTEPSLINLEALHQILSLN